MTVLSKSYLAGILQKPHLLLGIGSPLWRGELPKVICCGCHKMKHQSETETHCHIPNPRRLSSSAFCAYSCAQVPSLPSSAYRSTRFLYILWTYEKQVCYIKGYEIWILNFQDTKTSHFQVMERNWNEVTDGILTWIFVTLHELNSNAAAASVCKSNLPRFANKSENFYFWWNLADDITLRKWLLLSI